MLTTRLHGIPKDQTEILPETRYLTDGQRLFRVLRGFASPLEGSEGSFALLEDCRTLEAHRYTPSELSAMGLRLVEPATPDLPETSKTGANRC